MSAIKRVVGLVGRGLVVGALLGLFVPSSSVNARDEEGCVCNDDGTGKYQCNLAQTKCIAGSELCHVTCTEPT